MFFSQTNSLATFQTIMDAIFEDLISEGVVVVYLDDVLIFTRTLEEHQKVVQWVLEILQQHNLSLKLEKCKFEKTSVEYLGVVISHNSVNMDLEKVAGVSDWPTLTNKKEVQSFLGFINFYWRFIEGFLHIARLLFDLTKADSTFKWSDKEKLAFDTIRNQITSAPILTLPDNSRPHWVEADSLDFATRVVLSQHNPEDDKWHPVAFLSKSLSPVERDYEIHDKEMLAIVRALEEWRHFLEGAEHQVEDLDGSQESGVFHVSQEIKPEASQMAVIVGQVLFFATPPSRKDYGQVRCTKPKISSQIQVRQ